jgi:hypothetical protein
VHHHGVLIALVREAMVCHHSRRARRRQLRFPDTADAGHAPHTVIGLLSATHREPHRAAIRSVCALEPRGSSSMVTAAARSHFSALDCHSRQHGRYASSPLTPARPSRRGRAQGGTTWPTPEARRAIWPARSGAGSSAQGRTRPSFGCGSPARRGGPPHGRSGVDAPHLRVCAGRE